MNRVTAKEIQEFILNQLSNFMLGMKINKNGITENFDLLKEGGIDSLGIIELITSIQQHYGIEIDFENLDPDQLTILGPLSQYIETKIKDIQ